jgi:hypothetical protein
MKKRKMICKEGGSGGRGKRENQKGKGERERRKNNIQTTMNVRQGATGELVAQQNRNNVT